MSWFPDSVLSNEVELTGKLEGLSASCVCVCVCVFFFCVTDRERLYDFWIVYVFLYDNRIYPLLL